MGIAAMIYRRPSLLPLLFCLALTAACGGGGDSGSGNGSGGGGGGGGPYHIGGTATGLAGSGLVLQINGGETVSVATSGSFQFSTALASNAAYSVTVVTQPGSPTQYCSLANAAGVVASADITSIAVTCNSGTARFAYLTSATSATSNAISGYSIDAASGVLTPIPGSPWTTSYFAIDLITAPSGKFVYFRNPVDETVSAYAVDTATGALSPVTGSPFAIPHPSAQSTRIQIDPTGRFLYVLQLTFGSLDGRILTYRINPTTGALTAGSASGFAITGVTLMAFDPSGRYAYLGGTDMAQNYSASSARIDNGTGELTAAGTATQLTTTPASQGFSTPSCFIDEAGTKLMCAYTGMLYMLRVNLTSGALSEIAHLNSPGATQGLFRAADNLFVTNEIGNLHLYRADLAGSTLTETSVLTLANEQPIWIALDATQQHLLVALFNLTARSYSIDGPAGTASDAPGSPYALPNNGIHVATDHSGKYAFVSYYNGITAFSIDQATGALGSVNSAAAPLGAGFLVLAGTQ
jgi:6-phosphogluconolactonase (cycloisomerase 2 family)